MWLESTNSFDAGAAKLVVATDIESFQFAKGLVGVDLVGVDDEGALAQAVGRWLSQAHRFRHDMTKFDLAFTARAYAAITLARGRTTVVG